MLDATRYPFKEPVKYHHQLHVLKGNLSADWIAQQEPWDTSSLGPTILLHLVFVLRIMFQMGGGEPYVRTLGAANRKTVGATNCPGRRSWSNYWDTFL